MSLCPKSRPSALNNESPEDRATLPSDVSLSKRPAQHPYIDELPGELLLEILLLVCARSTIHYQPRLAAVCRRWRELVMHTPLFWTRFQVPSPTRYDTLAFFERSKHALIDLSIVETWDEPNSQKMEHLYNTIAQHASRLQTLNIEFWNLSDIAPIFDRWTKVETPHLETMSITSSDAEDVGIFPPGCPRQFFTPWPGINALRTLTLIGCRIHHFPPAPNLKFLELSSTKTDSKYLQDVFNKYPLLETLVLREFDPCPSCQVTVNAPSLRLLAICCDSHHRHDCECAFSYLSAKNLEYLEVGGLPNLFRGRHATLFSKLQDNQSLKKIRIHNDVDLQVAHISFLSSLSKSTALEFTGLSMADEVILAILELKNLQSITLTVSSETDLHKFSTLVCTAKPKLAIAHFLRLMTTDKAINPEVTDILGSNLTVLRFPDKPGFLDGLFNSDSDDWDDLESDEYDNDNDDGDDDGYDDDYGDGYGDGYDDGEYYSESPDYDSEDFDDLEYV